MPGGIHQFCLWEKGKWVEFLRGWHVLLFFETGSKHTAQTTLKLSVLLPQLFECSNYKSTSPLPAEVETCGPGIQNEKENTEPQDILAGKLVNQKQVRAALKGSNYFLWQKLDSVMRWQHWQPELGRDQTIVRFERTVNLMSDKILIMKSHDQECVFKRKLKHNGCMTKFFLGRCDIYILTPMIGSPRQTQV